MTPKKLRDEKRRAARMRNTPRHTQKVEALQKDLEEEPLIDNVEELPDLIEKDYGEPMMVMPANGPTSWEELDAEKVAREKAEQVREVTWNTQDLVNNIVYSSMPPKEKAKAIQQVGDGFEKRLAMAEKEEKMEKAFDLDLLSLQALIARDGRHLGGLEKVHSWISKAISNTAKLTDDNFAIPAERLFPINSKVNVRASLNMAAELLEKNSENEQTRNAIPALLEAAKKFGIGVMEKTASAVVIEKDASNHWRAVMWPSNNFIDWDGDILSEVAHKEYVEWVNDNMDLSPVFMVAHFPGTMRKNKTDFVGYESGFLLMSAPLEEYEAAALLKAQTITDLGMSHGTIVLERDPQDPRVVTKYRMVEVSDLPLDRAANPFTDFETLLKEADMSQTLDTQAYLATILGPEKAKEFIAKAGIKQKALQEAGVESKEKADNASEPASPASEQPNVETLAAQVFERVKKELDVEGLSDYLSQLQESAEKVPVLEALVKELAATHEDELADMIAAPAAKTLVWQKARASQSDKTVLAETEDDEKLKKAKPDLGWLSEATGTTPVQ